MAIEIRDPEITEAPSRSSYTILVVQFLATWLLFIVLITGTVLLMNVDWARPQMEELLSQSLNRKVLLGKMSWNLGLNGLAIATDKMQVKELNGSPFLYSGPSEIGVAFLPLIKGRLIIRHIRLQQPEMWAVRLDKEHWNFTDLLKPSLDIRFVDVNHGCLHIADQASSLPKFSPYEFKEIGMKFTFPRPNRRWPLFLSFSMPRAGYTTRVHLTTIGNGSVEDWRNKEFRFNINAVKLNPHDLSPFSTNLMEFGGQYHLQLTGSGVFARGIHAAVTADIENMILPTSQLGTLQAKHATSSSDLYIDPNKLRWKDLTLAFGDVEIHSDGALSRWQERQPKYEAAVQGKVKDLSELAAYWPGVAATASDADSTARTNQTPAQALTALLDAKKLTGEAEFDVRVSGSNKNSQLSTNIKAKGLSTADLLEQGPLKNLPWLSAMLSQASSKMRGEVNISENQRVDLPTADITAGASGMHISGFWDNSKNSARLKFSGQKIDLKTLLKNLESSQEFSQFIARNTGLPSASSLALAGQIDLTGSYVGEGKAHCVQVIATLRDVDLNIKHRNLSVSHMNGQIEYDGKNVRFEELSGALGDGKFQLNGTVSVQGRPSCDIKFDGDGIDLDNLNTAMQTLKVQVPILTQHQLYGRVQQLYLRITGSPETPLMSMTMVPADLYYQAPGVTRPLRATAGTITYDHDQLVLRDVPLISHNNQLVTNLDITNLSTTSDLKRVKVRSSGIELGDLHFFLSSALMPPALRQSYNDFVDRFRLSNARGKAYGNLLWQAKPHNQFDLDGVVGLYNASIKAGSFGWPLEHLSGLFAASGEELLVQDFAGSVAGNTFAIDGHITDYRSSNARWQTEMKAQVTPERALCLMPGLEDQFGGKISTNGPLALRAMLAGDLQSATMIFALRADPGNHLRVTTPFGLVAQPANQTITLDGSLALDTGKSGVVQVNNANLIIGSSLLHAKGKYAWSDPSSKQQPTLECDITAPNPVPAQTVVSVLNLTGDPKGISGAVTGALNTTGPINRLTSRGYLTFDKLTLPPFNLYDLTGKVETPGWSFDGSDLSKSAASGSQTNLHIDTAKFGSLESKGIDAKLVLETSGSDAETSSQKLVLHDGRAQVAGGSLKMDGWVGLTDHKFHVTANLSKVQANQVVAQLMGHPGEISGWADANLLLDSEGTDYKQLIDNLDGQIKLTVESGKVARFGQLQEKLTQANLLQSGILGFNFNNLLQSVMPVRTGQFKDLDASVSVSKGIVSIEQLKFNGDDMRLRAAGKINPALDTISLDVAGNVPRVSTSVLSGAVGEVSRGLSIQKFMSLVTMHKLENLPPVPILGEIADDRPRAFTFRVVAKLDDSHQIGQSIQKSFHWIPGHPNASAHPVAGLDVK